MDYITGITGGLQPPDNSTPPPPSDGPAPIWAELPPTDAVVRWDELEVWVRWLVERFRLGPLIPPCWPAHGWAVEELSSAGFGPTGPTRCAANTNMKNPAPRGRPIQTQLR